jgi:hypothetical protein
MGNRWARRAVANYSVAYLVAQMYQEQPCRVEVLEKVSNDCGLRHSSSTHSRWCTWEAAIIWRPAKWRRLLFFVSKTNLRQMNTHVGKSCT